MFDVEEKIVDLFCTEFNDKIQETESYDEYISSMKKDSIGRLLQINAIILNDSSRLSRSIIVSSKKKDNVIEDFKLNIKEIYTTILSNVDISIVEQLNKYLNNYKKEVFIHNLFDKGFNLHFIQFLKENNIAKIKYSKKENELYLYTPLEFRKLLKEILKDKNIKGICKKNSIYKKNLFDLLSVYGVINLKKLTEIYSGVFEKIDSKELLNIIKVTSIFDEDIRFTLLDEDYLIYSIGFDEDEAIEFYYSIPDDIGYKIFTKDEYDEIGEGVYHYNFDSFQELDCFLEFKLGINEDTSYMFDQMFTLDYLYSYQIDSNEAKRKLDFNLKKDFSDLNIMDKSFICKSILDIARDYPNFNYRGYSYNEARKEFNIK